MRDRVLITPASLSDMTLEHEIQEQGLRQRPCIIAQASLELTAILLSSSSAAIYRCEPLYPDDDFSVVVLGKTCGGSILDCSGNEKDNPEDGSS